MTKDEFLKMLDGELDKLEKEAQVFKKQVDFFGEIDWSSDEYRNACYQYNLVQRKIIILRKLLTLPAYSRIQAMSDVEIEEYKKEKIEELELKISEIESKKRLAEEEVVSLRNEQEALAAQFDGLTGGERIRAINRGKEISLKISEYKYSGSKKFDFDIENIKKEQEQIKLRTSEEIKQSLCSELKSEWNLPLIIEQSKDFLDASTLLMASVASEPEKARKMAGLLARYTSLSNDQTRAESAISFVSNLPHELEELLREKCNYRHGIFETRFHDELLRIVEEYEKSFEKEKTLFMEQFTEQKLIKLIGKHSNSYDNSDDNVKNGNVEVDMEFLNLHGDKLLNSEQLSKLQNNIDSRKKLSKKLIKTGFTKDEIKLLGISINQDQAAIYSQIVNWYNSKCVELFGYRYSIYSNSENELKSTLEQMKVFFDKQQQAIKEMKEIIQQSKVEKDKKVENYNIQKEDVAKEIRELAGEGHEKTPIPSYSDKSERNLNNITDASGRVFQNEVIDSVQREAQNQADIEEARLKGITVEELLQMRHVDENSSSHKR